MLCGGCVIFCFVFSFNNFSFLLTTFFFVKIGKTALHNAASNGFEEIVKILVEYGSNINIQTTVLIFFFDFLKKYFCYHFLLVGSFSNFLFFLLGWENSS